MTRKKTYIIFLGAVAVMASYYTVVSAEYPQSVHVPEGERMTKDLTPMQEYVTQHDGTEPAFRNEYWDHKEPGIYVDVVSGKPLFSSLDKFDSGTGWPSFTKPIDDDVVMEKTDYKLSLPRTEVRSAASDSHLGHVFDDGPRDKGGFRYCINSASLRFIHKDDLKTEGYEEYIYLFE